MRELSVAELELVSGGDHPVYDQWGEEILYWEEDYATDSSGNSMFWDGNEWLTAVVVTASSNGGSTWWGMDDPTAPWNQAYMNPQEDYWSTNYFEPTAYTQAASVSVKDVMDVLKGLAVNENANIREAKLAQTQYDAKFAYAQEVHLLKDDANNRMYELKDGFVKTDDGKIWCDTDFDGKYDLSVKIINGALWLDRDANGTYETNSTKMFNPIDVFNT